MVSHNIKVSVKAYLDDMKQVPLGKGVSKVDIPYYSRKTT